MKVKITEDSKKLITLEDVKAVKRMIEDLKEDDAKFDLGILSGMFKASTPKEYKAEITANCRIYNYYNEESKHYDVWLETELPEVYENEKWVIYKVGCYLSDIWSVSADNKEEIKQYMYIRKFVQQ